MAQQITFIDKFNNEFTFKKGDILTYRYNEEVHMPKDSEYYEIRKSLATRTDKVRILDCRTHKGLRQIRYEVIETTHIIPENLIGFTTWQLNVPATIEIINGEIHFDNDTLVISR